MVLSDTLKVRLFGLLKVPLISYVRPKVVFASDDVVQVKIPLTRRTKNHLRSMYFGALSVGADLAAGYLAMQRIEASGKNVSFVFQESRGQFLRRPTGDVLFTCEEGTRVRRLVDQTILTGERVAETIPVICTVPSDGDAVVARFEMTLSVKAKS